MRRERSDNEAEIEEEKESLSIEPISEAGCHNAGDASAEGVRRRDFPKSLRPDLEIGHDDSAERRYDHEV